MKTLLKRKSVLIFTGLFLFLFPTACKHQIVEELAAPVVIGDVNGNVVLPNGTNWKADELKIFASTGQYDIKDNKFEIKGYDLTYYSLLIAEHPTTKLTLFGIAFAGEPIVEFSASSTALALLMLNPVVPYLPEDKKKQLALSYSKHELFPSLVKEIEIYLKQNNEFLSAKNKIYDTVNQIHKSKVNIDGKRISGTQGTQGENETVEMKLTNNGFTLQNKASFLPYYAGVYNESGKELRRLDLDHASIINTGVETVLLDIYETVAFWEECAKSNNSNPECNRRFLQGKTPDPVTHIFTAPGKYKVKVVNAMRHFDNKDELSQKAIIKTGILIFKEGLSFVNKSLAEKFLKSECAITKSLSHLEEMIKFASTAAIEPDKYSIIKDVVLKVFGYFVDIIECFSKEEGVYVNKVWLKLGDILKFYDVFNKIGSGFNLLGITYNLYNDKNYYEYCIEVKPNETTFCKPDSIDPTKDPIIPTEVFQGGRSYGDPNIVTFDGEGYGFNGVGEFLAVKSTTDNFEIQVRQEELKNRHSGGSVSWNTGLAINTGSDRLCFYPNKYFINGTQHAYNSNINHTLASGGNVSGDSRTITVSNNTGDIIKVFNLTDMLNYSVIPSTQRQGKMVGIFGDYNKDAANDLKLRNGTPIDDSYASLYPTFTDSWRITQAQSLFVYDAGKNTNSYTDRTFPRSPLAMTAAQRASAEQTCRNAGVQHPFLEGCINDVVATGNATSTQWAKDLQEETVLRSFDIKFGEKEDMSLIKSDYKSKGLGLNYLFFPETVHYTSANLGIEDKYSNGRIKAIRPVSISNGFEFSIYFSGKTTCGSPALDVIFTPQKINNYTFFSSHIIDNRSYSNEHEWMDIFNGIFRRKQYTQYLNPNLFDGKIHKVVMRYEFDLKKHQLIGNILIDDVKVVDNYTEISNDFDSIFKIPHFISICAGVGERRINCQPTIEFKLYRWSFRSL